MGKKNQIKPSLPKIPGRCQALENIGRCDFTREIIGRKYIWIEGQEWRPESGTGDHNDDWDNAVDITFTIGATCKHCGDSHLETEHQNYGLVAAIEEKIFDGNLDLLHVEMREL